MQRLFLRHSLTTSLYDLAAESPAVIRARLRHLHQWRAPPPMPSFPHTLLLQVACYKKSERRRCRQRVRGASGRLFATYSPFLHFNDSLQPLFSYPIALMQTSIKRKEKKREGVWGVRTRGRRRDKNTACAWPQVKGQIFI